jgi:transglutaminase-like putative cysteine protease
MIFRPYADPRRRETGRNEGSVTDWKRRMALAWLLLWPLAPATAQEAGFTWTLMRYAYVLDDKGLSTGTFEIERQAHDAQAARTGARVDLSYVAGQETIEILDAVTMKADGRKIPVGPDRILDIAPQVPRDVAMYSDTRTRSVVFPDVAAGDSIRYVYRLKRFSRNWPGFSWTAPLRKLARVKASEMTIDVPAALPLLVEDHGVRHRSESSGERVRHIFSWSNDKAIPPEPGATSDYDWSDRFSVSTFKSYAEIGDYYARLHAMSAAVTSAVAELAAKIVGSASDRAAQARLLSEWVAQNVRYVAVSVGQGTLAPTPADETIGNRYGDCKADTALLAALLAARGIASEAVLINTNLARYVLPETPVADFNHVILYVPELDLYVDPTWNHAAFGVLPWGLYDKPVVHAVDGKSRVGRTPSQRAEDNVSEVATVASVSADGRVEGTTREHARGAMATDLKAWMAAGLTADRAASHLRSQGTPGAGAWISPKRDDAASETSLVASFKLADSIDLADGEALVPPGGLRFLPRPGSFLLGVQDTLRQHPFPCYAGRQSETIEVRVPPGLKPTRLPADRHWTTSIAEYVSSYAFSDGILSVRREFTARPQAQVCAADESHELIGLMSNIRRDYRAVVVFDRPL